ncbi:MAG: M23 family metallopeptidase [Candidatus Cloacimonetes bacterium]|nr:M23 family metallopeptidase [Candidatus Cloacimonadota bacterium]
MKKLITTSALLLLLLFGTVLYNLFAQASDFEAFRRQQLDSYADYKQKEAEAFERFYREEYELTHKIFQPANAGTLEQIKSLGISEEQIANISNQLEEEVEFQSNQTGVTINIKPEAQGEFEADFMGEIQTTHNVTKTQDSNGLQYILAPKSQTSRYVVRESAVQMNLLQTLRSYDLSDSLIETISANLQNKVSLNERANPNDKLKIMYEDIYLDGKKTADTRLHYLSFTRGTGQQLEGFLYDPNSTVLFTPNGEKLSAPKTRFPLDNLQISSPFGIRMHPIKKIRTMHNGIDYKAPKGTPIYAISEGTVVRAAAGWNGGFGNVVEIEHPSAEKTLYAHLNSIAVKVGEKVTAGKVIGTVGTTGNSTGNHLHFGYMVKNKWENPANLQLQASTQLKGDDLKKFQQQKQQITALIKENENIY